MPNRPIPDPVEMTFRDLRGALYAGDGGAAMAAIERRSDLDALQYVGDGLRLALAQGVTGAELRAGEHIAALRNRDLDGDEDLAIDLEAMLGLAPAPALRDLPTDLDDLTLTLAGDPLHTGGRLDLRTGDVQQIGPLYESDFIDESGEPDEDTDWADDAEVGEADERWLRFDSLGSRPGFRDMEAFLETVADVRLATRLTARSAAGAPSAASRTNWPACPTSSPAPPVHRRPPPWSRPAVARRIWAAPDRARRAGLTGSIGPQRAPLTVACPSCHLGTRPPPAPLGQECCAFEAHRQRTGRRTPKVIGPPVGRPGRWRGARHRGHDRRRHRRGRPRSTGPAGPLASG